MNDLKGLRENTDRNLARALIPLQQTDSVIRTNTTYKWNEYHEPRVTVQDGDILLVVDFDPIHKDLNTGHIHNMLTGEFWMVHPCRMDAMANYMLSIIEDPTVK